MKLGDKSPLEREREKVRERSSSPFRSNGAEFKGVGWGDCCKTHNRLLQEMIHQAATNHLYTNLNYANDRSCYINGGRQAD